MEKRPKIRIESTLGDKSFELLSFLLLILLWIVPMFFYFKLPDIIPTHINFAGKVDGEGVKGTLFIIPAVGTFIYLLLTILNFFPNIFNYPVMITKENALENYTIATRLLRYLKLLILCLFLIILVMVIRLAVGLSIGVWHWVTMGFALLIFVPIIAYTRKMIKTGRK